MPEIIVVRIGLVIRGDVSVAGHTDIVLIRHFIPVKHQVQVLHDHFLHADIANIMAREIEHIGNVFRDRHDPHHGLIVLFQIGHDIDLFADQVGERMIRIDDLRGKDRQDLFLKIFLHILLLLLLQFLQIQPAHPVGLQLFLDLRVSLVALFVKGRHGRIDGVQLLACRHAGPDIQLPVVRRRHVIEASHADHEEFVQVAGEDGNKLHPLHQRHRLIPRLLQHSLVEPEP